MEIDLEKNRDQLIKEILKDQNVKKIVNVIKSIKIKYYPNFAKISDEDRKIYEQL